MDTRETKMRSMDTSVVSYYQKSIEPRHIDAMVHVVGAYATQELMRGVRYSASYEDTLYSTALDCDGSLSIPTLELYLDVCKHGKFNYKEDDIDKAGRLARIMHVSKMIIEAKMHLELEKLERELEIDAKISAAETMDDLYA